VRGCTAGSGNQQRGAGGRSLLIQLPPTRQRRQRRQRLLGRGSRRQAKKQQNRKQFKTTSNKTQAPETGFCNRGGNTGRKTETSTNPHRGLRTRALPPSPPLRSDSALHPRVIIYITMLLLGAAAMPLRRLRTYADAHRASGCPTS
jgi:hypothetical protein